MKATVNIGRVSSEQMLKIDRAISREIEMSNGLRINHHRVVRSKKTYTRKNKHKKSY
jgi:hypothetical protein